MAGGEDALERELDIPEVLPLLPVRDVVVFPAMVVPLFVSREIGCATGLAWTPYGGEILRVEVAAMAGRGQRAGGLILTGQLGSVMQESAQAALSYLRAAHPTWAYPPTGSRRTRSTCTSPPERSPRTVRAPARPWPALSRRSCAGAHVGRTSP